MRQVINLKPNEGIICRNAEEVKEIFRLFNLAGFRKPGGSTYSFAGWETINAYRKFFPKCKIISRLINPKVYPASDFLPDPYNTVHCYTSKPTEKSEMLKILESQPVKVEWESMPIPEWAKTRQQHPDLTKLFTNPDFITALQQLVCKHSK